LAAPASASVGAPATAAVDRATLAVTTAATPSNGGSSASPTGTPSRSAVVPRWRGQVDVRLYGPVSLAGSHLDVRLTPTVAGAQTACAEHAETALSAP
jgi:hypothetical protein